MIVLNTAQMQELERLATSEYGLTSRMLMEAAGRSVCSVIFDVFSERLSEPVTVICGPGNNGGDGFVVARVLKSQGVDVILFAGKKISELKGAAKESAESALNSGLEVNYLNSDEDLLVLHEALNISSLVIDALLATGIKRPVEGQFKEVVKMINNSRLDSKVVISVDLPSGVDPDTGQIPMNTDGEDVVTSDLTVTFQNLKPAHIMFPASNYCGDVIVADIGLPNAQRLFQKNEKFVSYIDKDLVVSFLSQFYRAERDLHKGQRGHVVVIGGSEGMFGAPKLSGNAALKVGAGLVTLALPQSAAYALSPMLNELMSFALEEDDAGDFSGEGLEDIPELLKQKKCVVIGPGLGHSDGATALVTEILSQCDKLKIPHVVDADAINVIASHSKLKELVSENTVLTPHPGEMARLLGVTPGKIQISRVESALSISEELGCWVVLKGARTVITGPQGQVYINPSATSVLATAGSGDVLSGVIAGLIACGLSVPIACISAVFCHGATGEILEHIGGGPAGVLASDVSNKIPEVLNYLYSAKISEPSLFRYAITKGATLFEMLD